MACCEGSINCTDLNTPRTIQVLPDIVGIGILTSFLITAGIAFFTLILGYFMDFLPGDYLSWADWGFLQTCHFRTCCRLRYKGESGSESGLSKPCRHINPEVDAKRRKSLTAFLLTLSDQQLVTGPAMIVAALSQHCQISVYEFQVVSSVAWLASTTHLSTLIILRQYFRENGTVRNFRVIGMLANLGLLIYTTIVSDASYSVDKSVHIQCVTQQLSSPSANSFNVNTPITILFLIVSYFDRISQLYNENHSPLKNWLQYFCCKRKAGPQLSDEEFERWYVGKVWHSQKRLGNVAQRDIFWRRAALTKSDRVRFARRKAFLSAAVLHDYQNSFLSEIPSILLSASYGITQVVVSRMGAPSIQGSENTVDFGQIVPIFLLTLPFLAALESYCEAHSDQPKQEPGSISNIDRKTKAFRAKFSAKIRKLRAHEEERNSANTTTSDIELCERHQTDSEAQPREWISYPEMKHPLSSYAIQRDSPKAIAVDPKLLYPYSRKDVRLILNTIFFSSAALSISTGVLLWVLPLFGAVWGAFTVVPLVGVALVYAEFLIETITEVRVLRKGDIIKPARGTRAPRSSILDATTESTSVEESVIVTERSESPVPMFDPRDVTDANHIIQALSAPPRRQTTGFEVHAANGTSRRPAREDTESNIGIDSTDLYDV